MYRCQNHTSLGDHWGINQYYHHTHHHQSQPSHQYHQEINRCYLKNHRRHGLDNLLEKGTDRTLLGKRLDYRQIHHHHNQAIRLHHQEIYHNYHHIRLHRYQYIQLDRMEIDLNCRHNHQHHHHSIQQRLGEFINAINYSVSIGIFVINISSSNGFIKVIK